MRRVAVALLMVVVASALSGCLGGKLVGGPVPAFEVVTADDQRVNETTHLGKFLILDLMATWCGPCKLEVAHLRQIQSTYGDRVEILSISVEPTDTLDDMAKFSQDFGATWPHALDPGRKVAGAMGLSIIPKLIIVDPQGIVVFEAQGEVLPAAMARVIDPTGVPPASEFPWLAVLVALGVGALGAFNPYRRFHRQARVDGRHLAVLATGLVVVAGLAWVFSAFASSRSTLGSLFIGGITLVSIVWWMRAREKTAAPPEGSGILAAGDRLYEAGPHFALVLVLALQEATLVGYAAPVVAFVIGFLIMSASRERVPERSHVTVGLVGLALVGLALVINGARLVLAEA